MKIWSNFTSPITTEKVSMVMNIYIVRNFQTDKMVCENVDCMSGYKNNDVHFHSWPAPFNAKCAKSILDIGMVGNSIDIKIYLWRKKFQTDIYSKHHIAVVQNPLAFNGHYIPCFMKNIKPICVKLGFKNCIFVNVRSYLQFGNVKKKTI